MPRCIFENLSTEQAKVLSSWFEGQGEQDADYWFEEANVPSVFADIDREGGYKEVLENGDVVVYCKTIKGA